MKKTLSIVFAVCLILAVLAGCKATKSTVSIEYSVDDSLPKYIISEKSTLEQDLEYFGIEMTVPSSELALSDLLVIFPDEGNYYFYFRMPEDAEDSAYRVSQLWINGFRYSPVLLEENAGYQKYSIADFHVSKDTEYEISRIDYINELNENDHQIYNMSQICTVSIDESRFYFTQEYQYRITLQGKMFESIYQFNKNKNVFQDLWNNIISNPEGFDEDRRSFFYFAFNCYDVDRNIHFVPDDILQLTVNYNQLTYQYSGSDKTAVQNIRPEKKRIEQVINPDSEKVISSDKRSNKKIYQYETINNLGKADWSKNKSANAGVLEAASHSYDWAVQFGDRKGYVNRNLSAGVFKKNYDIDYTQMEDFNAIHIIYRYDGAAYSLNTNSLIASDTYSEEEVVTKADKNEKEAYRVEKIRQDASKSTLEKFIEVFQVNKIFGSVLISGLVIFGVYCFVKCSSLRVWIKRIYKKLHRVIQEKKDDE